MRKRTEICVECGVNPPAKGRVCDKCRGQKRKEYHKQRYEQVWKTRKAQYNEARVEARKEKRGQEPLSRYSLQYQDRKRALEAYGATCQDCGWDKIVNVLQVHHIDKNRNNHDLANLAVLCPTCHM